MPRLTILQSQPVSPCIDMAKGSRLKLPENRLAILRFQDTE